MSVNKVICNAILGFACLCSSCDLLFKDIEPDVFTFNESSKNFYVSAKGYLYITCQPSNYLDLYDITYTSSDSSVVFISEQSKYGVVFLCSKEGSAIIYANMGKATARCAVNVYSRDMPLPTN